MACRHSSAVAKPVVRTFWLTIHRVAGDYRVDDGTAPAIVESCAILSTTTARDIVACDRAGIHHRIVIAQQINCASAMLIAGS